MDSTVADTIAAAIAAAALLLGGILSWQAAQQPTSTMNGSMMDSMMDGTVNTYGTDPLVYLLGGLLLAVVIAGGYLVVRDQITAPSEEPPTGGPSGVAPPDRSDALQGGKNSKPDHLEETMTSGASTTADSAGQESSAEPENALLKYLPDDERRVLEPVIESPGVTQIEIRDRSDFSKSKVSQTLSELEKRGLIYKEKQGRTFRVYPGEELASEDGS